MSRDFVQFNLDARILKVLAEIQYETPTPVQAAAIPPILEGRDMIACAQTGTGKTGAFMLPILHQLAKTASLQKNRVPDVLVLAPTRELALQIAHETKKFSKHLPHVKTACIYGGVPYFKQKRELAGGCNILVATPGRLIDALEQKQINLSKVRFFVLDEADRMLDMGFIGPVERIIAAMPAKRQTLLFSATIDNKVLPLSKKWQDNPVELKMESTEATKGNIEQFLYYVDDIGHKMRLLDHLLETTTINQMIVFTSTIKQTIKLADYLQAKDYRIDALHGDMNQRQRTKTISKLRQGIIQILIATDVAARGIDIASLSHVINFDLPFQPGDFIHRIGRTGRAGAKGVAITFAAQREAPMLAKINELFEAPLTSHTIEGLEPKGKSSSKPPQQRRRPKNRGHRPGGRPARNFHH